MIAGCMLLCIAGFYVIHGAAAGTLATQGDTDKEKIKKILAAMRQENRGDEVRRLLEKLDRGIKLEHPITKDTLLHEAAHIGNAATIIPIFEWYPQDLNTLNKKGQTPLDLAIPRQNNKAIVDYLRRLGALSGSEVVNGRCTIGSPSVVAAPAVADPAAVAAPRATSFYTFEDAIANGDKAYVDRLIKHKAPVNDSMIQQAQDAVEKCEDEVNRYQEVVRLLKGS
jgi:ankyrin repeat protein